MVTRTHRVRSVYVNLIPVWECRLCGQRWRASADYTAIERQSCRGWAW